MFFVILERIAHNSRVNIEIYNYARQMQQITFEATFNISLSEIACQIDINLSSLNFVQCFNEIFDFLCKHVVLPVRARYQDYDARQAKNNFNQYNFPTWHEIKTKLRSVRSNSHQLQIPFLPSSKSKYVCYNFWQHISRFQEYVKESVLPVYLILHLTYLLPPDIPNECCRYAICPVIAKLVKEKKLYHTALSNSRLILINENTQLQLIQLYLINYIKIHFFLIYLIQEFFFGYCLNSSMFQYFFMHAYISSKADCTKFHSKLLSFLSHIKDSNVPDWQTCCVLSVNVNRCFVPFTILFLNKMQRY